MLFFSPGPYLELFARRNRLGWDTVGNECLDFGVAL
jgi:N6-adenosine-specific RNA methylase IME4